MILLLVLYFVVVLVGVNANFKDTCDYLSIENTQAIKGIFILMVFYSHFNSYITEIGPYFDLYRTFFNLIGQAMVTLFLFYSGYGVMESIKRKGKGYISKFPKNRIFATLFKFDCAVILYLALAFILGKNITVKNVILSLIGWESVGNSNWYIFVILFLYLLTYIVFKLFSEKNNFIPVFAIGILLCAIIYLVNRYQIKETYWYDTALCYVMGMGYSLIKEHIEGLINKNNIIWLSSLGILTCMYLFLHGHGTMSDMVANLVFAAAVVVFTMHITLKNKVLIWCGENLFEIYILQRIPMIVFKELGIGELNVYLYFVLCILVTLLLSLVFSFTVNKIWKKII